MGSIFRRTTYSVSCFPLKSKTKVTFATCGGVVRCVPAHANWSTRRCTTPCPIQIKNLQCHIHSVTLSLSLSLSLSFSLSLPLSLSRSIYFSLSSPLYLSLSPLSLYLSHSISLFHALSHCLSLSFTLSHSISLCSPPPFFVAERPSRV